MKEQIESKLKEIEANLKIYKTFSEGPGSQDDRNLVSFKMLFEMISLSALKEFAPEYVPEPETMAMVGMHLQQVTKYISIVGGKVIISPEYRALIAQRDEFLKNQKNGKLE